MSYKIKLRVTRSSGETSKFSAALNEGDRFPLDERLIGLAPSGIEKSNVIGILRCLTGRVELSQAMGSDDLLLNGKLGKTFFLKPGDVLQILGHSVEFIEVPVPKKALDETRVVTLDIKPPVIEPLSAAQGSWNVPQQSEGAEVTRLVQSQEPSGIAKLPLVRPVAAPKEALSVAHSVIRPQKQNEDFQDDEHESFFVKKRKLVLLVSSSIVLTVLGTYFFTGNDPVTAPIANLSAASEEESKLRAPASEATVKETTEQIPAQSLNIVSAPVAQIQAPIQAPTPVKVHTPVKASVQPPKQARVHLPVPHHMRSKHVQSVAVHTPAKVPSPVTRSIRLNPKTQEEFFKAARTGDMSVIQSLVQKHAVDPNATIDRGMTALMHAAANNRLAVVKYLILQKVNLNTQDTKGTTALMWASFKGNKDVVKLLILSGANTTLKRKDGDTAYGLAWRGKKTEVMEVFKSYSSKRIPASTTAKRGAR